MAVRGRSRRRGAACFLAAAALVVLAACAPQAPALGVWELTEPDRVAGDTIRLELGVTRLECSSGVTGDVLDPVVTFEQDRILIRADVAPLPEGAYGCPGNDVVTVTVELAEPVGDRELVDAACLDERAVGIVSCEDGGVRWSPDPAARR